MSAKVAKKPAVKKPTNPNRNRNRGATGGAAAGGAAGGLLGGLAGVLIGILLFLLLLGVLFCAIFFGLRGRTPTISNSNWQQQKQCANANAAAAGRDQNAAQQSGGVPYKKGTRVSGPAAEAEARAVVPPAVPEQTPTVPEQTPTVPEQTPPPIGCITNPSPGSPGSYTDPNGVTTPGYVAPWSAPNSPAAQTPATDETTSGDIGE